MSPAYRHPSRATVQGWIGLIAAIVADTPMMPDAEAGAHQERRARSLCFVCPCLEQCREWASGQRGFVGVVAGHVHRQRENWRQERNPNGDRTND